MPHDSVLPQLSEGLPQLAPSEAHVAHARCDVMFPILS